MESNALQQLRRNLRILIPSSKPIQEDVVSNLHTLDDQNQVLLTQSKIIGVLSAAKPDIPSLIKIVDHELEIQARDGAERFRDIVAASPQGFIPRMVESGAFKHTIKEVHVVRDGMASTVSIQESSNSQSKKSSQREARERSLEFKSDSGKFIAEKSGQGFGAQRSLTIGRGHEVQTRESSNQSSNSSRNSSRNATFARTHSTRDEYVETRNFAQGINLSAGETKIPDWQPYAEAQQVNGGAVTFDSQSFAEFNIDNQGNLSSSIEGSGMIAATYTHVSAGGDAQGEITLGKFSINS